VPATLVIIVFLGIPLLYGISISFQLFDLKAPDKSGWIGLTNYQAVLADRVFQESVWVTLRFCAMFVAFAATLSLVFALALNRRFRGGGVVRIVMLLPFAMAPIVAGLMWRSLFHGSYGLVNATLVQLGIVDEYIQFFSNPGLALFVAALGVTWIWVPFFTLILLAAMQAIPDVLHRAARMDGAGPWRRFTDVTFPAIRNVFTVTLLIMILVGLETFDLLFSMTRGGPGFSTSVLNYLTYVEGFERLNLGRSAALAVMITVLVIGIGGLSILLVRLHARRQSGGGMSAR
jgi:ABC-type sugar transport system permease subunit